MLFFIYFSYLFYLVNLCQYGNQTYGINQSIITKNCEKKYRCNFSNGTTTSTCKPLCHVGKDPKCNQSSQRIKEYHASVNDSNCTCTRRICISGMIDITNSIHLNETCDVKFLQRKVLIEKNFRTWWLIFQCMTISVYHVCAAKSFIILGHFCQAQGLA